jgi:CheY-like chemotaxis protein
VGQILTFIRQKEMKCRQIRLEPILRETVKFVRATIPTKISVETAIEADIPSVDADPTQLHQVLMNLCTNALQAMEKEGGVLTIELGKTEITPIPGKGFPEMKAGIYTLIIVRDTGTGMTPGVMERIFEPYYTTKKKGEGTGLGLSIVHGIIKKHGGYIKLHSVPGEGTEFKIFLPAVSGEPEIKPTETQISEVEGGGAVLFVDDEKSIRRLYAIMLTSLGYSVETARDGEKGLELFRKDPKRFDIVITDHKMPKMDGFEFARAIRRIDETIPVVLCTGYSYDLNYEDLQSRGFSGYIKKPVGREGLNRFIRRRLTQPSGFHTTQDD